MCSVLYLTLKNKLFCTLYKIINVGASTLVVKSITACQKAPPRPQGATPWQPEGSLLVPGTHFPHHRNAAGDATTQRTEHILPSGSA